MPSTPRTGRDSVAATDRLLSGLARGDDLFALAAAIEALHPARDTFPGEVFLRIAAQALELTGAGADDPIDYQRVRRTYLGEYRFRGWENRKIQYAILASAAVRGGVEPDLLNEVLRWQTDDFWWYALAAAVALIRACAERTGEPVEAFAARLAAEHDSGRRSRSGPACGPGPPRGRRLNREPGNRDRAVIGNGRAGSGAQGVAESSASSSRRAPARRSSHDVDAVISGLVASAGRRAVRAEHGVQVVDRPRPRRAQDRGPLAGPDR